MKEVVSKTINIKAEKLTPSVEFVENEFKKLNLDVIRWAIVEVNDLELSISCSYLED